MLADHKDDDEALDELFLATLTRLPDRQGTGEVRRLTERTHKDRRAAFADALWALINTREFILNH